jgi:hypothetical protein
VLGVERADLVLPDERDREMPVLDARGGQRGLCRVARERPAAAVYFDV